MTVAIWRLDFAAALLVAALWAAHPASAAHAAEGLAPQAFDFEILDTATGRPVGHGQYAVEPAAGAVVLRGTNRYSDGRYDVEEDRLAAAKDQPLPVLVEFRHTFFNPDGSIEREGHADLRAGFASCRNYASGRAEVDTADFKYPGDTYAGASILIPIQEFLRRGGEAVNFHLFNCASTPRVVSMEVRREQGEERWRRYPGVALVKVDATPDFGFLNFLLRPFAPRLAAWFDPAAGWTFVGGDFRRYYRGRAITLVKSPKAGFPGASGASPAAEASSGH